jgi:glycosyltransferase involved in cell wall biosynthesis
LNLFLKKLFIIAPHFPPSALPPSQRVRLIVQHAASLGFFPTVFTVEPKYREEMEDPWMTELVGDKFNLVMVDCLDQNKTRKFKIGDLGLRILPFLFFKLRKYIKKDKPDFILYPVPPWYILMIAPLMKRLTGVPYGIDFIDPWVHDLDERERSTKKIISHWISRRMEKHVCKHASIIYAVSQGINDNLIKRYPYLKNKIFITVPYGAEQNDFDALRTQLPITNNDKIVIRYIGALWMDCYKVLDGLMPALAEVKKTIPLQIEFLGTGYASEKLSKKQLDKWIIQYNMKEYTFEQPYRVTYRRAVELTLQSDVLLLMGGMAPYYAASKLMGLLVSKKPFVAFLHEDSFPAKLLLEINFPYVVTYGQSENRLPIHQTKCLTEIIKKAIAEKNTFNGVDISHPVIQANTAFGMTKTFLEPINKILA